MTKKHLSQEEVWTTYICYAVYMPELSKMQRWWLDSWPHRFHVRFFVPKFLKASPDPFRGEVLEVGAGSGWTSRRILETFPQVELTATDLDPRAITSFEKLQNKFGQRLKVKRADVYNLSFDREAFDIVIAVHVMHYLDNYEAAIEQLLRVLRQGGLLGISDRHSLITRKELEELITSEGAEVVLAEGREHFTIWARKPYNDQLQ